MFANDVKIRYLSELPLAIARTSLIGRRFTPYPVEMMQCHKYLQLLLAASDYRTMHSAQRMLDQGV